MSLCPVRREARRLPPCRLAALALALVAASASQARPQHLPFTTYTAAEGLPGDRAVAAVEDAEGFLWIGTDRGLSRYDGLTFRSFDRSNGLDKDDVTSLALGRDGTLWIGVWGAAYRFDGRAFTEVAVEGRRRLWERVHLAIDAQGRLWCGADGLYRLDKTPTTGAPVLRRLEEVSLDGLQSVDALLADRLGNVWAGGKALYRVTASGGVNRVEGGRSPSVQRGNGIVALEESPGGRILAATRAGVQYLDSCVSPSGRWCTSRAIGMPVNGYRIIAKADGGAWIGSADGLVETNAAGNVLRKISKEQGLVPSPCWPLLLDRRGDLWVGSDSGVQRLAGAGFAMFGLSEGLEATQVASIFATQTGDLVVDATPQVLQRLGKRGFTATRPRLPPAFDTPSWGWYQIDLQDHLGEWWIPTANGLVRFPAAHRPERLARARPAAVYRNAGCFRGRDIFRLYEDTRGDIWIATVERNREGLYRWNRSSQDFACFVPAAIVGESVSPTAFLDDGRGTLWIGFGHGQVARYRGGTFQCVMDCGTGTNGLVHGFLLDSRRRLWIATASAGLFRVDRPDERRFSAARWTVHEGLSSNLVRALAADRFDHTYVGTDRGVDVLDGHGEVIRHFGTRDGLPHPHVTSAWTDARGDVWFGTLNGVARFTPPAHMAAPPRPRVLLGGVRVTGVARPLSAMGQTGIDGLVLAPDQREIEIDVVGLPRAAAPALQFQYRRSGGDEWSAPTSSRSLVFTGLSAGRYQYEIRAVSPTGISSSNTVFVRFSVLAPIYGRPWFVALLAVVAAAVAFIAYRARLAHLVALERQRSQIAMDLHDEMGSKLGSIGLLADVAADPSRSAGETAQLLDQIGEVASEMGSSLTDIVRSLREGEMTVESLARQLAEHGRRLFPDSADRFAPDFPATWPRVAMSPAARRGVFLVGLEALHNAARHSRARRVTLRLQPVGRHWRLTVEDDGIGIGHGSGARGGNGFGVDGMKRRASMLCATLDIQSHAGTGTTLSLLFDPRAESRKSGLI